MQKKCPCGGHLEKLQFQYRLVELDSENTYTPLNAYLCTTCGRFEFYEPSRDTHESRSIENGGKRNEKLTCPNCGSKNTEGIECGFVLTTKESITPKLTLEVYCYDCGKQTPLDSAKSSNLGG